MQDTVTALNTDWTQVSGDVAASEYGATFAQLDTIGDKVYGVNVVEIINMVEACGSDYDVKRNGGAYVTEESYCDVDTIEWHKARDIMRSCGGSPVVKPTPDYPEDVQERVDWLKLRIHELSSLFAWERRPITKIESDSLSDAGQELLTLEDWYTLPRTQRAEMMHSYGGYRNGQSLTFASLREAMEYHSIPASALWRASEYDSIPSDLVVSE